MCHNTSFMIVCVSGDGGVLGLGKRKEQMGCFNSLINILFLKENHLNQVQKYITL